MNENNSTHLALLRKALCDGDALLASQFAREALSSSDKLSPNNQSAIVDELTERSRDHLKRARVHGLGGIAFSCGRSDYQLGYATGTHVNVQSVPRHIQSLVHVAQVAAARFHTAAICANGALFTWGLGTCGRLGHGNEKTLFEPTQVEALRDTLVTKVSLGDTHSIVIADGKLLAWGGNKHFQLGVGGGSSEASYAASSSSSGEVRSDAEANNSFQLTPKRVKLADSDPVVVDVETSSSHTIAVSACGTVYTWGSNEHGELGHKDILNNRKRFNRPLVVSQLQRMVHVSQVIQVAASDGVSCVLCCDGKVYQWGHGSCAPSRVAIKFQPGVAQDPATSFDAPKLSSIPIAKIAAGPKHLAAISRDGEVYTWGGAAHLLGHCRKGDDRAPSFSHIATPMRVEALVGKVVTQVSCSTNHTVAIDSNGSLFSWGQGDCGVLGREASYQPAPSRVSTVARVTHVATAECTTVFTCCMDSPPSFWKGMNGVSQAGISEEHGGSIGLFERQTSRVDESDDEMQESDNDSVVDGRSVMVGDPSCDNTTEIPTLFDFAQTALAQSVDLYNVVQLWTYADALQARLLDSYCRTYILLNIDALVIMNPAAFDLLHEYKVEWYKSSSTELQDESSMCANSADCENEDMQRITVTTHTTHDGLKGKRVLSVVPKQPGNMDVDELQRRVKQCHKRLRRIKHAQTRLRSMSVSVTDASGNDPQSDLDQRLACVLKELTLYDEELKKRDVQFQQGSCKSSEMTTAEVIEAENHSNTLETPNVSDILIGEENMNAIKCGKPSQQENSTRNPLYCELCKVTVPDSAAMVDHIDGKRHRKYVKRLAKDPQSTGLNHNASPFQPSKPKGSSRGKLVFRAGGLPPPQKKVEQSTPSKSWGTVLPNSPSESSPTPSRPSLREVLQQEARDAMSTRGATPSLLHRTTESSRMSSSSSATSEIPSKCLKDNRFSLSSSVPVPFVGQQSSRTITIHPKPNGPRAMLLSSFIERGTPSTASAWQCETMLGSSPLASSSLDDATDFPDLGAVEFKSDATRNEMNLWTGSKLPESPSTYQRKASTGTNSPMLGARTNSPLLSSNRTSSPLLSSNRTSSPLLSSNRTSSPLLSSNRTSSPMLSASRGDSNAPILLTHERDGTRNSWGFQPKRQGVAINDIQSIQMAEQLDIEREQEELEIQAAIEAVEAAIQAERKQMNNLKQRRKKQNTKPHSAQKDATPTQIHKTRNSKVHQANTPQGGPSNSVPEKSSHRKRNPTRKRRDKKNGIPKQELKHANAPVS